MQYLPYNPYHMPQSHKNSGAMQIPVLIHKRISMLIFDMLTLTEFIGLCYLHHSCIVFNDSQLLLKRLFYVRTK